MVVANRELSNSFVAVADADGVDGESSGESKQGWDRKQVWGLFCVYAAIGTINGFFATYFNQPTICQYVFGPMGEGPGDYTTQAQCNAAGAMFQMSWNFKLFFGFFLDVFPFFGSRRKGWLLFGWTGGLVMLAVNALLVQNFIDNHQFESYLYSMMGMCIFYTFSDVAGDGMIIEVSKNEPADQKGYILTTCQMLRFTMMMFSTGLGTLFMSGKDYLPPDASADTFVMPFELSFAAMHWLLLGVALPFYAGMWMWLKDPPVPEGHTLGCGGVKHAGWNLWKAMQSFAIFMLLIQSAGINGVASMVNPANAPIQSICQPTNLQSGIGALLGNIFFVAGVWIFRQFFLNRNWRFTLFMTQAFTAVCSALAVMAVYDVGGFSQNGWFYMLQSSVPLLIQGIGQVVSSLAVVEVSPSGLEATVYELLISASNGAISLSVALQTVFGEVFGLGPINYKTFHGPEHGKYERLLAEATFFCLAVNVVGAALFMWCLPTGPRMCKEWMDKKGWHNWQAAALNTVIFVVPFVYANTCVILDVASG
jgi:hypothetical protein